MGYYSFVFIIFVDVMSNGMYFYLVFWENILCTITRTHTTNNLLVCIFNVLWGFTGVYKSSKETVKKRKTLRYLWFKIHAFVQTCIKYSSGLWQICCNWKNTCDLPKDVIAKNWENISHARFTVHLVLVCCLNRF